MEPAVGTENATGIEAAQHLRIEISKLWLNVTEPLVNMGGVDGSTATTAESWQILSQHLTVAEHALVEHTRRIAKVLEQDGEQPQFVSELHVGMPIREPDSPGPMVALRRVSQAAERLAQLLESLKPEDLARTWFSERRRSTLAQLVEEAFAHAELLLRAASSSMSFSA
jgi:hypothetical protein